MRIYLTATTPEATPREREQFKMLIEPRHRRLVEQGIPATVGGVLDLEPIDCRVRFRTYKESTGYPAVNSKRCGKRTCSRCVVSWLCDRVAPAWAYWGGQATVRADSHGLTLRGPQADPGVVVATFEGGGWVFAPGDDLRGNDLNTTLVRMLRGLRLEEPVPHGTGDPVAWYGTVPDGTTPDQIRQAAEDAGIEIFRQAGGDRWHAKHVTPEQNQAFTEALWAFRWSRGGPPIHVAERPVHLSDYTPAQRPVHLDEIAPLAADSPEERPVHLPEATDDEYHNRSREVGPTFSLPCILCDMQAEGRLLEVDGVQTWSEDHDRTQWSVGGNTRTRMAEAHGLRLADGVHGRDDGPWVPIREPVVEMVKEGDYWYPKEYIERLKRDGEEIEVA